MQTVATFAPVVAPVLVKPIMPNMTSLASGSASALDKTIKSQCSGLTGESASQAGKIIWQLFYKQVGIDILKMLPPAIIMACTPFIPLVPPGFMSPPVTSSIKPGPAILSPGFILPNLVLQMTPYCTSTLSSLGPTTDNNIKGSLSSLSGEAASQSGSKVWDIMLLDLGTSLQMNLNIIISSYVSSSGSGFTCPLSLPGAPIGPNGPQIGGTPVPAVFVLA